MVRIERLALVPVALLAIACGDRTSAAASGDTAAATTETPQLTDGNIVALLANTHQAEISLATTARSSAASEAVKDYAARMIAEHGAMKSELDSLAARKGIASELPPGTEPIQAVIAGRADTLLHTTGRSTDIAYMDGEAKAHGATLELLYRYAAAAKDEELRRLIGKAIADVRLHQDRAIDILRGL